MYKKLCLLLFAILLIVSLFALSGCDKECEHSMKDWRTPVPATCLQEGVSELYCMLCGQTLETKSLPVVSHQYPSENAEHIYPTCTKDGQIVYHCLWCDATETEIISSPGHHEVIDSAVPPTETSTGLTEGSHCDVCGEVLRPQHVIPANCKLYVQADPGLSVLGLKDTYQDGEVVTLTVIVEGGYRFLGWYGDTNSLITTETTCTFTLRPETSAITLKSEKINVTDITLDGDLSFDIDTGALTLSPVVTPADAYFTNVSFSIVSGADSTGATLNGNLLTATAPGDIVLCARALDKNGESVFEKSFTISVFTSHIGSLEITNETVVLYPDKPLSLEMATYPPTAYPRGEYIFQLASNTCGAKIENGILTATTSGSVRVRVRVDDSEWSPFVKFYVPTPIATAEEFYNIHSDLSGYYYLTADIDLSSYSAWSPIGYAENNESGLSYDNAFKGYLDGNGYKITGLTLDVSKTDYITVGLFGAIDNSAIVKNIKLIDYRIEGISTETLVYLGGVAGILNGEVSASEVSGSMNVIGAKYIGGVTGQLFGKLTDTKIHSELIIGNNNNISIRVGGAVGFFANGTFANCDVISALNIHSAYGLYAGGTVGEAEGNIENVTLGKSSLLAFVTDTDAYIGLYVGKTTYRLIENVEVEGSIHVDAYGGTLYLGAIAGQAVNIRNCKADVTFQSESTEKDTIALDVCARVYFGLVAGYVTESIEDITLAPNKVSVISKQDIHFGLAAGYVGKNIKNVNISLNSLVLSASKNITAGLISGECKDAEQITATLSDLTLNGIEVHFGLVGGKCGDITQATVSLGKATIQSQDLTFGTLAGVCGSVGESTLGSACELYITVTGDLSFGYAVGKAVGTLSNLHYTAGKLDLSTSGEAYVGGIVGHLDGNIQNATFCGDILLRADSAKLGGIAGYISGQIHTASANGNLSLVADRSHLGGIVGYGGDGADTVTYRGDLTLDSGSVTYLGGILAEGGKISDAKAYSVIHFTSHTSSSSASANVGGLTGLCHGTIENVYFFGYLNVENPHGSNGNTLSLGGIVGSLDSDITNAVSNATITIDGGKYQTLYAGGVIGNHTAVATLLKADGDITVNNQGFSYIGGIVGHASSVHRSYSVGNIQASGTTGALFIGGIAGKSNATIRECYHSFGDIRGVSSEIVYVGGIVGGASGNVQNCYASYTSLITDMSKTGAAAYLGGIVASLDRAELTNCYSMCFIEGKADGADRHLYVGGLVGSSNGTISSSYTISATNEYIREEITIADIETTALNSALVYAGGLVGRNSGTIQNCYASNVLLTRNSYTGGLVGYNEGSVRHSLSLSQIQTALGEKVGAFVGYSRDMATYVDCFFSKALVPSEVGSGTGPSDGILPKTTVELRGTAIYANYDKSVWEIVNGKNPKLILSDDIWGAHKDFGYPELKNVQNPADQHGYPIPDDYCKLTFDVGLGEYPETPIYVYKNDEIFLVNTPRRIGYTFGGWYFDEALTKSASEGIITLTGHTTVYAKWIPITYHLDVEADGKGTPVPETKDYIYLDEITLSTTDIPLDYYFVGWFDGETLLSTEKTYTFPAPAGDLHITAKYLTYYDLTAQSNRDTFGTVTSDSESGKGKETAEYTVKATPKSGYTFFGWFFGDTLISTESEYTFRMPSENYTLTARFTAQLPVWDGSVATGFSGGTGTEDNPYIISSGAELAYLAQTINSGENTLHDKYYRLNNSIDLGGLEWDPIGCHYYTKDSYKDYLSFNGHFDGNGFVISNFKITTPKETFYRAFGLFGYNVGAIENLGCENFCISLGDAYYVGGLVGYCDRNATINACHASGTITVNSTTTSPGIGGLVGYNRHWTTSDPTISESYANCDIQVTSQGWVYVGGLIGHNDFASILNCYACGTIRVQSRGSIVVGGLTGIQEGYLSHSYADIDIRAISTASGVEIGGLTGRSENLITECVATGKLFVSSYIAYGKSDYGPIYGEYVSGASRTNCGYYISITADGGAEQLYSTHSLSELKSKAYYEEDWNSDIWYLCDGRLPTFHSRNTYHQLFVTANQGGKVDITEAVLMKGTTISLIVTPATGYKFVGWYIGEECIGTGTTLVYSPDASVTLVAKFENIDYTLSASSTYPGIGDVKTNANVFHYQDMVTLSAKVVEGYEFLGWFIDGECISENLEYSFRMPAKDVVVTARYCKYFTLTVESGHRDFGTATGSTSAYETGLVPVVATPKEGYRFFGWFLGDTLVSTDTEYLFPMPSGDTTLVARFTAHENDITDEALPPYIGIVGETYYQIILTTGYYNGATGDINLREYIVKAGDTLKLVATAGEGFELYGWFDDLTLLSEDDVFLFTPTKSTSLVAEFDLIRYTFITEGDKGLTISDHERRYYEGDAISVTVTVADGYLFDGWFLNSELVSTDRTYAFTMPPETYILVAKATPIDYHLSLRENLADGGEGSPDALIFHVEDEITLSYTTAPGYRFLGFFEGDTCLSTSQNYTFSAPAHNLTIEARCELIPYDFTISGTSGGSFEGESGKKTVVDTLTLVATPEKGYDFIGWYIDNKPYSYDKTLHVQMPAHDLSIEARFKEGFVTIRTVSGFHGTASGGVTMPKDSEITLIAIPDEGYRFVGWFLGGELVSTDEVYTALYDVSGSYAMHALFDLPGVEVTYHPENKTESFSERIDNPETYLFPYAYYEGYIFDGWYLDPESWQVPLTADVTENTNAYAKWTSKNRLTTMFKDLAPDYSIEMYTRVDISDENLNQYIKIYDVDGKELNTTVKEGTRKGYYIVMANFTEGATYQVEAVSDDIYLTNHMRTFVLSFAREEVMDVEYGKDTVLISIDDILAIKPAGVGITLRSDTPLSVGNLLYCYDDPAGVYGYIEQLTLLEDGTYDIIFSSREVKPEDIFVNVNIKQDDLDFDLADATVIGDKEKAAEAFAEVAAEASSVNLLMNQLTLFAAKNPTFRFDKEPTVDVAEPIISGKLIEFKVTLTVNGERQNSAGETLDKFAIRLVVTFRNEISTSCDLDFSFPVTVKKFEFTLKNVTTIAFNLDLVYGNEEATSNFEALETLLKDYQATLDENKEAPFDTSSEHASTFEAFELSHSIPIGETGLFLKFGITPFLEYEIIGQIDINTSFSVINTCTASYIKGDFDVYHNCETDRVIEVYALAYLKISLGLDAELKLYFALLEDDLYAKVNLKVGPYLIASGALRYEQHNSAVTADLTGFVEWGYFYDIDVSINLIIKEISPDIDRVEKPLGNIGHYYLYFEFKTEKDAETISKYSIDIREFFDHEVYLYDLAERIDKQMVSDKDEYSYSIEDNPYLYINRFGQLIIRQAPTLPITVDLYISIGPSTNRITKTVELTIDVKQYDVLLDEPKVGTLRADKSCAMEGEMVSFEYYVDNATYLLNREFMVVTGWLVNGEYVESSATRISFPMQNTGLEVQVITRRLTNVYEIRTISDLDLLRAHLDGTFVQTADIDLEGRIFNPIGTSHGEFRGTYYGCGYTIRNFALDIVRIETTDIRYVAVGFFGVAYQAKLHDMHLENVRLSYQGMPVNESDESQIFLGSLIGASTECELYRCSITDFTVDVTHESLIKGRMPTTWVGGLVGFSSNSIVFRDCSATDLDIHSYVKATLTDGVFGMFRTGGERNIVGGLIGESYNSITVSNCYTEGSIRLTNAWQGDSMLFGGGIAGLIRNVDGGYHVRVENCLTDIVFDDNRTSKKCYSAIANIGNNASSLNPDKVANNVYYVNETYTNPDIKGFDSVATGESQSDAYSTEFLYHVLGFDAMCWTIKDGKIIFTP